MTRSAGGHELPTKAAILTVMMEPLPELELPSSSAKLSVQLERIEIELPSPLAEWNIVTERVPPWDEI